MGCTVAELESRLTSQEFIEWLAYYELEPFGQSRDNMHAAQVASLIYNAHRSKQARPMDAGDFMFKDEYSRRAENTGEFMAGLRSMAKKVN